MSPLRLVTCALLFRTEFAPGVDNARLTEDAHGLIFDRSLALDLTPETVGWGIARAEFTPPASAPTTAPSTSGSTST
ncbi:hypothetical protein [Mariniluteicoccus flavus]